MSDANTVNSDCVTTTTNFEFLLNDPTPSNGEITIPLRIVRKLFELEQERRQMFYDPFAGPQNDPLLELEQLGLAHSEETPIESLKKEAKFLSDILGHSDNKIGSKSPAEMLALIRRWTSELERLVAQKHRLVYSKSESKELPQHAVEVDTEMVDAGGRDQSCKVSTFRCSSPSKRKRDSMNDEVDEVDEDDVGSKRLGRRPLYSRILRPDISDCCEMGPGGDVRGMAI